MKLAFKIARRYLFSKKSTNAINIISGVAMMGILVATFSFILVLSVFNGFEDFVSSLYNTFNPDFKIEVKKGKFFTLSEEQKEEIWELPGVKAFSAVLEENAVVMYKEKPLIVTIKGVDQNYRHVSMVDTTIVHGEFLLQEDDQNFAVIGFGVEAMLGIRLFNQFDPIYIYLPKRNAKTSSLNPENAFEKMPIMAAGTFSIQADFDSRYVIVPLRFARELMKREEAVSTYEVALSEGAKSADVQQQIAAIIGDDFVVKDRYQQDEFMYKVMQAENWAVYAILSFILLITGFNIIGSLSMLVLEKRKDIGILKAMGGDQQLISRIFLLEGLLLAGIGAFLGMLLATIVCLIQMHFEVVKLGGNTFLIDAYPVSLRVSDFVWVSLTVVIITLLASYFPAKKAAAQSQLVAAE